MGDYDGVVRLDKPCSERPESNGLQRYLTDHCQLWREIGLKLGLRCAVLDQVASAHPTDVRECLRVTLEKWLHLNVGVTWGNLELAITNANREDLGLQPFTAMPPPRGEEGTNQRDNHDDNITTGDVVKKNFRRFVLNKLRKHYLLVVGRVMDIFEEREVNIQRIIRILQYDENNVISTDSVFETIRTTDELLKSVGKYCNGIYDYSALDIFVQASRCREAIKELNDFTEMLQKSILKELDLLSDHGELLHPDDFMSGTYKFIIQYSGGKCTKGTKDMIQDIVEQSVRLKKGVLIFKGFDIGSVLLVYQISEAVKNYLLQFRLTKQNLLFLEGNNITGLMVDGIEIMELNKENKLGYRTSRYKDHPWLSIPQEEYEPEYSPLSRPAISRAIVHKKCTFNLSELRQFLNTITNQIDLPTIALFLASKEVIELHLAQELLQFTGGIREKGVKVMEIFNQLQRREDRVPFFLQSLLDSGDSSPANRELYEKLSKEMDFTDRDLDDACKTENKLGYRTSRYKDRSWLSIPQQEYRSFLEHPIQSITQGYNMYSTLRRPAISWAIAHKECAFKFSELRRFLNTIINQIDLPAIALFLASKEVIELHLAQELLQFTGGIKDKGVKVVEIFDQLQKQEDRVPFFLRSLLDSGDSSPANRELYEKLSKEMDFTDSDLDDACKSEVRRRSLSRRKMPLKLKRLAFHSREIGSSTSNIRKFSSPQPYMSDIPTHVPVDSMQEENVRLRQEVERLQKMLDWSFGLLSETQKNLTIAQNKLKVALYHRTQYDFDPVHSRGVSSHISPSSERRIRNVSRSADSIQHELKLLQLQEENFKETSVHGQSSTTTFDQKSPGPPV